VDRARIIQELQKIIGGFLKNEGLDLVELIYRYEASDLVLRVLVDKPQGGITLDDLAYLNQEIGRVLDQSGTLEQNYILEVSSPGIDRPLINKSDFLRCLNRKARFFLKETVEGRLEWEADILGADDTAVTVEIEGRSVRIPFDKINRAKQAI
jgi:ribosome maturation factor RimP